MNERLEAVVRGRVQMVMFRDFTARKARGLGLVGEVKNLADGTVQVAAEGERGKLEALLSKLKRGSILSRVEGVDIAWRPVTGQYQSFDITYG